MKKKNDGLISSFANAIAGIKWTAQHERNMRIHICLAIAAILAAVFFSVSRIEWLIIILLIAGMLTLELVNTAIEKTVDLITDDFHPYAKIAKDAASGAVFLFAIVSLIVGAIIFLPKILLFFFK